MTDIDKLAMDIAALRRIDPRVAMAALDACVAGNNMPLRRMGYDVTREMSSAVALAEVADYSAGQAENWLRTYDAERQMVRE